MYSFIVHCSLYFWHHTLICSWSTSPCDFFPSSPCKNCTVLKIIGTDNIISYNTQIVFLNHVVYINRKVHATYNYNRFVINLQVVIKKPNLQITIKGIWIKRFYCSLISTIITWICRYIKFWHVHVQKHWMITKILMVYD